MQRILKLLKHLEKPQGKSLVLGLLHDKIYSLFHGENNLAMTSKHYYQAFSMYQNAIDPKENNEENLISLALTFNLCNGQKHPISAMVAMDQFELLLEKNNALKKSFENLIEEIKKRKEEEKTLSLERITEMMEMMAKQNDLERLKDSQANSVLIYLLMDRISALENSMKMLSRKQLHLEKLHDDRRENRKKFYNKMATKLSHIFTAMAVTSGTGENPIVKHDRTGTESA